MPKNSRIPYQIPGKDLVVYIDPIDGNIYSKPIGNKTAYLSNYDMDRIQNFILTYDLKNGPFTRFLYNKVSPSLKSRRQTLLSRVKQSNNNVIVDEASETNETDESKNQIQKQEEQKNYTKQTKQTKQLNKMTRPTYNYNFSQYYTDNPNGDKSKPIAHNYFNADQYSSRSRAFKAARDAGHGVFTWRGKAYNTMEKGDNADEFRKNHSDYDAFIGQAHRGIQDGIDNSGGWSGSSNYKPEQIAQTANPLPVNTPQQQTQQTPQRTRLEKFTDDDIKSLSFNNYQGLLNAAMNPNNKNNRFLRAMYDKYGDASKWNQTVIEGDLGIKGKYRRFGGGDFGDMSRSMMAWVGKNNGEIDKQDLQNRTGSDGIVYSSKEMRDLYEKYNPKKQQSSQTGTTQTNTSTNTPSTTQNQSPISWQPGGYKFSINQNNNAFSGDYSNPYSNFGYALSQQKKFQKGGTINMEEQQLQQAFLQYLMQQTGAKDQQQLEQVIQQLGEEGLKQAYSKFLQEMQQQQVQAAKFGAKLNYIRRLNGQCPDGTELTYFKVGGKLCKKCIQRQQREQEAEEPSDPIKAFKCGRKMKRK